MRFPLNKYLLPLLLLSALPLHARKAAVKHNSAPADTILISTKLQRVTDPDSLAGALSLAGYDKTRDATCESIFMTNTLPQTVTEVTLLIDYRTIAGEQLHRRSTTISCIIPPGETRRLDFKSWDRQNLFYYHRSPAPARAQATPYDVAVKVTALLISD